MSAVHINTAQNFESKWSYKSSLKDNKSSSSIVYKDNFEGWLSRAPSFKTAHPDIASMELVEIEGEREEGNLILVTLKYESTGNPADAAAVDPEAPIPGEEEESEQNLRPGEPGGRRPSKYNMEPTLSEEPILTFHKMAAWSDETMQALRDFQNSDKLNADYEAASTILGGDPDAMEVLKAIANGQESYLNVQVIWSKKTTESSLSNISLGEIGKIAIPPGNPPSGAGHNWLCLAPIIAQSPNGGFEVEERWQRSYAGGWSTFFYD